MALSPSAERRHLHTRRLEFEGYRRSDGLFDIEGRLTDIKTYDVPNQWRGTIPPGEPIHDMRIRLTVDGDYTVRDIEVETAAGPFRICPDITPRFAAIKGTRVGRGWHRRVKELFGGVNGCTHQMEMLGALGTVVFQTVFGMREVRSDPEARPLFIDSCHALASDGEAVKSFWPQFYTGS